MDLLRPDRTLVMGVMNLTPDSFSDGGALHGRDTPPEVALARGRALLADGADILDIGGESTRPGATRIEPAEEQERILGVIGALAADGAVISVDTLNSGTAAAAAAAGARIINDVSGGTSDPAMYSVVADLGLPYVLQHSRGAPATMANLANYTHVVAEVIAELRQRIEVALAAGMREDQIILDPGLGFAKDADHNWQILAGLDQLLALGFPVLIGASRKRFLGPLVPEALLTDPKERDHATAAITAIAAMAGVWGVRVHEPRASRDAAAVAQAWRAAQ